MPGRDGSRTMGTGPMTGGRAGYCSGHAATGLQTDIHITILRHGETEWNTAGRHQGQLDSPLTALGVAQAEAAAAYLQNEHYDCIYTSDLNRALATAQLIGEQLKVQLISEPRLRERHLGIIQGLTKAELQEQYPDVYQNYLAASPDYLIPDGESARQCSQRVADWMADLAQNYSGKSLLVITHGIILSNILKLVLGIPLEAKRHFSLYNVGINRFTVCRGEWRLELWGDISHIQYMQTRDETLGANL